MPRRHYATQDAGKGLRQMLRTAVEALVQAKVLLSGHSQRLASEDRRQRQAIERALGRLKAIRPLHSRADYTDPDLKTESTRQLEQAEVALSRALNAWTRDPKRAFEARRATDAGQTIQDVLQLLGHVHHAPAEDPDLTSETEGEGEG